MSTVFHGFRVPKQDKFLFTDGLRKHVLDNWRPVFENEASKIKQADFIQDHKHHFESEAQFFEITAYREFREVYLVRILESGYLLKNYLWGLKYPQWGVDTRVESLAAHKQRVTNHLEKMIEQRHYFVIPIVSVADYLNIIYHPDPKKEEQRAEQNESVLPSSPVHHPNAG